MTNWRQPWPVLITLSALGVGWLTFADIGSPARFWLTCWFMFICPGMAWVRLLRLPESYVEWSLAIALSLALAAIVSGVMLYAGVWSPRWGVAVLIGISEVGAIGQWLTRVDKESGRETAVTNQEQTT